MPGRDEPRTTADIATAARVLGLPIETLRKRLQRGRMNGVKAADGTWRVVLDKAQLDASSVDRRERSYPDVSGLEATLVDIHGRLDGLADEVRTLRRLLEAQPTHRAGDETLAAVQISRETAAELRHVLLDVLEFLRQSETFQR